MFCYFLISFFLSTRFIGLVTTSMLSTGHVHECDINLEAYKERYFLAWEY